MSTKRGYFWLVKYIVSRLVQIIICFMLIQVIIFLLPRAIPGNPIETLMARLIEAGMTNPEALKDVEKMLLEYFEFDKPLHVQFITYMSNLLRGDLGKSVMFFPKSVNEVILSYLPWTLALMIPAIIVSWIIGNALGVFISMKSSKRSINAMTVFLMGLSAIPPYILGFFLIYIFAVYWKLLPVGGGWSPLTRPSLTLSFIIDYIRHYTLPFVTLVISMMSGWAIGMRGIAIKEAVSYGINYLRTVGVKDRLIFRYLFRASMAPQLYSLAIAIGWSITGSVITEIVFNYPGLGSVFLTALRNQDYMLIQGFYTIISLTILLAIFITDLAITILDPRIRHGFVG
ncbi:MAG: ABC transporter permease [Ignisphaera sp.]